MAVDFSKLKVAIVHDWLVGLGGGERVVESLSKIFPQADIYTSVYDESKISLFGDKKVYTSFLQHWPLAKSKHQLYATLRPLAFERFDLSGYDLVISSCSAESKGVITPTETLHLSYIHTPIRYYWSGYSEYLAQPGFGVLNPLVREMLPRLVKKLRIWDFAAAQRPDVLVANSDTVAKRIKKYYHREAKVITPPVNVEKFTKQKSREGDYYLVVSRLIPYKRVDLAILACNQLGKRLIVAGRGPELKNLKKIAGPTVEFQSNLDDRQIEKLYLGCKAFIFPGYEDFGITPVEAMAAGKPVICFAKGGATETVVDGITGVYHDNQSVESLVGAIKKLEIITFDSQKIRRHAEQFSESRFIEQIRGYIDESFKNQKLQ